MDAEKTIEKIESLNLVKSFLACPDEEVGYWVVDNFRQFEKLFGQTQELYLFPIMHDSWRAVMPCKRLSLNGQKSSFDNFELNVYTLVKDESFKATWGLGIYGNIIDFFTNLKRAFNATENWTLRGPLKQPESKLIEAIDEVAGF